MHPIEHAGASPIPQPATVMQALLGLVRDPWRRILLRWNGKSAMLSALFRGVIFLLASLKSHHAGRNGAAMAEAFYGAASMGFFGTLAQALRFAEPQWAAQLILAGIFPVLFQLGNLCFHLALEGHIILSGMIASAVFTALSALFNLYIMRRGTMLVGGEGKPFYQDLGTLPKLALLFVISGEKGVVRLVARLFHAFASKAAAKEPAPDSASS